MNAPSVAELRRAWTILRIHGPRRFAGSVINRVRARLGAASAGQVAYANQTAATDAAFDAQFGVATGGVEYLHKLTILGPNARFGVNHIASGPAQFASAMASIDLDLSQTTFVDLGSGRGRAMIMAAMLPFRKVIGLEFARELHEASIANIRSAFPAAAVPGRIIHICGDAAEFEFPDDPLVLYLYNPFDAPIISCVARSVLASWQANPRPIRIIYLNPVFACEFSNAGWECREEGDGRAIFAPPSI